MSDEDHNGRLKSNKGQSDLAKGDIAGWEVHLGPTFWENGRP